LASTVSGRGQQQLVAERRISGAGGYGMT
jgi:hypothetical protein